MLSSRAIFQITIYCHHVTRWVWCCYDTAPPGSRSCLSLLIVTLARHKPGLGGREPAAGWQWRMGAVCTLGATLATGEQMGSLRYTSCVTHLTHLTLPSYRVWWPQHIRQGGDSILNWYLPPIHGNKGGVTANHFPIFVLVYWYSLFIFIISLLRGEELEYTVNLATKIIKRE